MVRAWLLLLLLFAVPAWGAESAAVRSERVTATLVTDTDHAAAGRPLQVGLRLRIAPAWHTYWRNPGDAGAAPEVALTLPAGATAGGIAWPTPMRLPEGPLMTYGYTGEVLLPITVVPAAAGLRVEAAANWLVCEKICVPEEGRFVLDLPGGEGAPSAEAPLFAATATRLPRPSPFAATVAPDGTLSIAGDGLSAATVRDAWFFPASAGSVEAAAPAPVRVGPGLVQIGLKPGSAFAPGARLEGVVVLRDPGGQESALAVSARPGAAAARSTTPLLEALLLAALGGLILNVMPCVFPILAMKAMGVARLSGAERGRVRGHAAAYTAGVLLAFGALGLALVLARAAGSAAGWGFQFQSPEFVAAMAWLLFLIGLNLSGVFELGAGLAGAGQGLAGRGGHAGSFFTGLLAVLVATPCTAPFMGAAIAAALAAPTWAGMLIFLALGLGFAVPYAALALWPGLARALPRPGRWMDVLRGALAFPMYGAAAWLLWVVSMQSGAAGVIVVAAGAVVLGFGAWAFGLGQREAGRGRIAGRVAGVISLAAAGLALTGLGNAPGPVAQAAEGVERFTPARLETLHAEGRPVFVNMTASWCVTCLVNERVALAPERVRAAFTRHGVAYLKGDWTRGDPEITGFLRAHERDGVPLYVLYPPGTAAPRVLPQILTEAEILSELDRLGG